MPLATVAFAFVAQFPVFQDFLRVLENFLLRYTLPETAAALVRTYVVGLAEQAASLTGLWIVFVIVTAALVVDSVETEINADLAHHHAPADRAPRDPLHHRRDRGTRAAGRRDRAHPLDHHAGGRRRCRWPRERSADFVHVVTFLLAVVGFTLLYVIVPACPVKWRHGLIGGLLAAAAFELSRTLFAWYVANSPTYEILYGALAAVPVFMLWVFVFWMIVLAGAAVTASIAESESAHGASYASLALQPRLREYAGLPCYIPHTFRLPEQHTSVVHHPGRGLADLAAHHRVDHRARADLRAPLVASARRSSRRRAWSTACSPSTASHGATPELLAEDRVAGAARAHPRGGPRQRARRRARS